MAFRSARQEGSIDGASAQPAASAPKAGFATTPVSFNDRLYNLSDNILRQKKPTPKELNGLKIETAELRKYYQAHERKDVDIVVRLLLSIENGISGGSASGLKTAAAELKLVQALGEIGTIFKNPSMIGSDPKKAAAVQGYCAEIAALSRYLPPNVKEKAEGFADWVGSKYTDYSRKADAWFVENPKSSLINNEKFRKNGEDGKAKDAFNALYSSVKTEVMSGTEMPASELARRIDRVYVSAETVDRGLKRAMDELDFGDHLLNSSWLELLKTGAMLNMGIDIGEIGSEKILKVYTGVSECDKNFKDFKQNYLELKSALQTGDPSMLSESVGRLSQSFIALSYSQASLAILIEDYDLKGFEYVMPALSKAMDMMMAMSLVTGVGAVATLGRAGLMAAIRETGTYMLERGMKNSLKITFAFFVPETVSDAVSTLNLAEAEKLAQTDQLAGLKALSGVLQTARGARKGAQNAGDLDKLIGDINTIADGLEAKLQKNPGYKLDPSELAGRFIMSYGQMLLFESGFGLMRSAKAIASKRAGNTTNNQKKAEEMPNKNTDQPSAPKEESKQRNIVEQKDDAVLNAPVTCTEIIKNESSALGIEGSEIAANLAKFVKTSINELDSQGFRTPKSMRELEAISEQALSMLWSKFSPAEHRCLVEALKSNSLDCDASSLVLAEILSRYGVECSLVEVRNHAILKLSIPEASFYLETTPKKGIVTYKSPEELLKKYPVIYGEYPFGSANSMLDLAIADIKASRGDHAGAMEYYNRSIDKNQNSANAYCNRGAEKYDIGDTEGALNDYKSGLRIDPNNPELNHNLGEVELEKGNYAAAEDALSNALRNYPKTSNKAEHILDVKYMRGKARVGLEKYDLALNDLNAAIKGGVEKSDVYYYRGKTKNLLGDRNGAMADYNKAIELDPNNSEAYYSRAIQKTMHDPNGALSDFEAVLRLDPRNENALQYADMLREELGKNKGVETMKFKNKPDNTNLDNRNPEGKPSGSFANSKVNAPDAKITSIEKNWSAKFKKSEKEFETLMKEINEAENWLNSKEAFLALNNNISQFGSELTAVGKGNTTDLNLETGTHEAAANHKPANFIRNVFGWLGLPMQKMKTAVREDNTDALNAAAKELQETINDVRLVYNTVRDLPKLDGKTRKIYEDSFSAIDFVENMKKMNK